MKTSYLELSFHLISDFLAESLKANKNWKKNFFYNTFSHKKPHLFYEHQLTQHYKKYIPANMFLVGVRKAIYTAPFLDTKELHSRSFGKANICIFLYVFVKKVLFRRHRKLLSGGGLNNFLKAARCLDVVKCFKKFYFNWNFWKFNCFSAFWYFHQ